MAMRYLSPEDFYAELKRNGLTPTDSKTATQQIWQARDGQLIPVPIVTASVPDYVVDTLLQKVSQLYQCANPHMTKSYEVSEDAQVIDLQAVKKPLKG